MKWIDLTCVVCGFRYSPRRFIRNALQPISYPAQTVTGGGRARGFHVVEYVPWSDIMKLKDDPNVWRAVNCEYIRLGSAYDSFYDYLHFLSPRMLELVDSLNREIFRLRAICRDLRDRLDRLHLTYPRGGDSVGEFGGILEEINKRNEEDRRSALDLIK